MRSLGPAWVTFLLRRGFVVRVGNYRQTAAMRLTIQILTCAGVAQRVGPWRGDWPSLAPGNDPYTADTGTPPWSLTREDI